MEKPVLLDIRGLSCRLGAPDRQRQVLRDLALQLTEGELVCLIGRSGCGKSTLLNIIAGFLPADQGTCLLAGRPITGPGPDRCVVFQEDALFPWLTVRENIAFGLHLRDLSRRQKRVEVDRYLEMVGLSGHGRDLPRTLSGGMKQRVALARVLILEPRLLLMDEPFGSLDAQSREEMQELLLRLSGQRRQTILFITHDVQEAAAIGDRVLLLDSETGRISRELTLFEAKPRDRGAEEFLRACARLHRWLRT